MIENRGIVIPGPNTVELIESRVDETSWGPDEVWVRTHYTLISAGTEGAAFAGIEPHLPYPVSAGYAAVGEVVHAGTDFPNVRMGEMVFCMSGHERYSRVHRICVPLPAGLDPSYAPIARLALVAMTALRVSALELGDWAAVIGQGTVGNLCAQLLQLAGVEAIGIDLEPRRLELAQRCGIRHVISGASGDDAVRDEVLSLTEGRGVEATIEAAGNPRTIHLAARITGRLGEVILLGSPRGTYEENVTTVLNYFHPWAHGSLTLKSAHEWRYPIAAGDPSTRQPLPKHSIERNTRIVLQLMLSDRLSYRPLRTHLLLPELAQEAYEGLTRRRDEYTGVMLDWTKG